MQGLPPSLEAALQDRYVLERELGRGGMATVYLAHDRKHDRPVALKVLRPELAATLGLERFLLEIRVTARLQHPHILPLLDSGMIDTAAGATSPFYAMPYVEGESLRSMLRRERQLSLDEALRLAGDVASALAYAHSRGVVHRDVKPENILLSNGQAVVADFGIARAVSRAGGDRLTSTGLALGTPHYMSPEQTAGNPEVDARADVYALGCVLYEMLAGEPPFTGATAQAVAARSLIEPAPPVRRARPNVSEELDGVIARALAKVPADRFADATAFGEALARAAVAPRSQTAVATPARARRSARSRWWSAGLAIAAVLTAAAVLLARRHRSVPATIAPASSIAVLPFTPSGPDTVLSRLGRDLAFTLSAELDGLGGLHVVDPHTVLAHGGPAEAGAGPDRSAAAHALGAGSLVQGSLVRVGGNVRLDLALVGADSAAALLARATVTAPPDSVAVLTDSAARALLVQIWSHGSPPTPSLDGALRTRSVQALRAFLQGEGEITNGNWGAAAASYERAIAADPAFWLAYARDLYALQWLVEPPDSLVAVLERHRFELPERERLSTEAILLEQRDSIGEMIARARSASERYPDSWFGWLILGDDLLHYGPLLGVARTDARSAFERAVTLNPDLIPVWEHLMLGALVDGDTVAAGRALGALTRLRAGPSLTAGGYGTQLLQFRFLDAIQRSDSALIRALIDSVAHDPAPSAVPDGSFFDAYRYGAFAEQIAVSRKALAAAGPPDRQRVQRLLLALSWGGRGAWDSALVNLDRVAAGGADSVAALRTYGLAVAGVWLDALEPRDAIAHRPAAADAARADRTGRGELAWLDGVLAAGQRDRRGLAAARAALGRSGDPGLAALDRSLGAFDAALRGATAEAGRTMAALEWEEAALTDPDFVSHPLAVPIDRLAAARWLAAAGDAEEALRLLRWADGAFYLHPSTIYGLMFAGLADLERGRIEGGLGHTDVAAGYYRRFLQRYDRPVPRHAALVKEARARASQRSALEPP